MALTTGVPYPELVGPCGCTKWSQGCGLVVVGSVDVQLSKTDKARYYGIEIIDGDRFAHLLA